MSFELTDRPIAPKVILVDDKNRYLRDISYTSPKIATAPIEKDLRADGQRLIVYSDGGSRNNPGPAACAYIICSEDGDILKKGSRYLGIMSNNEAEYHGLIDALTEAKELGAFEIAITMDSELVVRQVRGEYKIKAENLKPLFATVQGLLSSFRRYDILHAPREHPMISKADELVNIELDLMSQRTKL
ncbi:MAG: ribonuclease HI family protein [Methanomassiliicoccales archaeon]|nr:MAG: ribonuclease HI family protein [Methanomassiliicoccales archaeon]